MHICMSCINKYIVNNFDKIHNMQNLNLRQHSELQLTENVRLHWRPRKSKWKKLIYVTKPLSIKHFEFLGVSEF